MMTDQKNCSSLRQTAGIIPATLPRRMTPRLPCWRRINWPIKPMFKAAISDFAVQARGYYGHASSSCPSEPSSLCGGHGKKIPGCQLLANPVFNHRTTGSANVQARFETGVVCRWPRLPKSISLRRRCGATPKRNMLQFIAKAVQLVHPKPIAQKYQRCF